MLIIKDTEIKNLYADTLLVAKRAKAIKDGSPALTEESEKNAVTQAIKELKLGMIKETSYED